MSTTTIENTGVLLADGTRLTQQNVPIATTANVGLVKPDGVSISVDAAGTINALAQKTGYDAIYIAVPLTGNGSEAAPLSISVSDGITVTNGSLAIDASYNSFTNYYTKEQIDNQFALKTELPKLNIPVATDKSIGGVIVGDGLSINNKGVLSVDSSSDIIKTPVKASDVKIQDNVRTIVVSGCNIPLGVVTDNNAFVALTPDDYSFAYDGDVPETHVRLNRAIVLDKTDIKDTWYILSYRTQ